MKSSKIKQIAWADNGQIFLSFNKTGGFMQMNKTVQELDKDAKSAGIETPKCYDDQTALPVAKAMLEIDKDYFKRI